MRWLLRHFCRQNVSSKWVSACLACILITGEIPARLTADQRRVRGVRECFAWPEGLLPTVYDFMVESQTG